MIPINPQHYHAIHHWLKITYGRANRCENKECLGKSKNYNWAKKKDKEYAYDRDNFEQLCRSCHSKLDVSEYQRNNCGNFQKIKTKCPKGHPYNKENTYLNKFNRRSCKICRKNKYKEFRENNPNYNRDYLKAYYKKNPKYRSHLEAKKKKLSKLSK